MTLVGSSFTLRMPVGRTVRPSLLICEPHAQVPRLASTMFATKNWIMMIPCPWALNLTTRLTPATLLSFFCIGDRATYSTRRCCGSATTYEPLGAYFLAKLKKDCRYFKRQMRGCDLVIKDAIRWIMHVLLYTLKY